VEVARRLKVADDTEILLQSRYVVVPVDGHGQRVADKHAPQGAPPTVKLVKFSHHPNLAAAKQAGNKKEAPNDRNPKPSWP
jgi:hypothetical protein